MVSELVKTVRFRVTLEEYGRLKKMENYSDFIRSKVFNKEIENQVPTTARTASVEVKVQKPKAKKKVPNPELVEVPDAPTTGRCWATCKHRSTFKVSKCTHAFHQTDANEVYCRTICKEYEEGNPE